MNVQTALHSSLLQTVRASNKNIATIKNELSSSEIILFTVRDKNWMGSKTLHRNEQENESEREHE